MEEAIKEFAAQFSFEPVIENKENLKNDAKHFIVAGMGGDRKSTRLNSSHSQQSRMPSSA